MTNDRGIHLGIIPDGSRRWAKGKDIDMFNGKESGETVEKILHHILGKYPSVREVSVWALSTDNLNRPDVQKRDVFNIIDMQFMKMKTDPIIQEKGVRVNVIGSRFSDIPSNIRSVINDVVKMTKSNKERILNVCIGYGGREEILDAVMASSRWLRKNPTISRMHENVFEKFLAVPRPLDLVIRTGGEKRLSGFMLYQIEYAELFFTDTLWPAFTTKELDKILAEYKQRERRFGK